MKEKKKKLPLITSRRKKQENRIVSELPAKALPQDHFTHPLLGPLASTTSRSTILFAYTVNKT